MNFKKIKTDFVVSIAKIIAKFPLGFILSIGHFLGLLTWLIPNKRKKIAATNIALCFSELSAPEQSALVKKNLISTGLGFMEMIVAFWSNSNKFISRCEFHGLENVEQVLSQGKGCLMLSCHLHPIELVIKAINMNLSNSGHMLARQHNNKIFEAHIDTARRQHCEKTIDKKDIKSVLKSLKSNHPVYYVPDQNFSYQFEYIDFFNQPAATVIAPARLAQASKTPVIPWFGFRSKDEKGKVCWKITILKPLDYFHDSDTEETLVKMNQLFEEQIRKHPEQYLWVHRRFKNHPNGRNFIYKDI